MKTVKSVSKRFSTTATGKIRYKRQGLRHILTKKSTKRKRSLRKSAILSSNESKHIRVMLASKR